MKRQWKVGLFLLAVALLMLAVALLVRPRLSRDMQDYLQTGTTHYFDDVDLSEGGHYRLAFDERLPRLDRDPSGIARFELYLEPLLEDNVDPETGSSAHYERSELAGITEIEVECRRDGLRVTSCKSDSTEHIDFTVASDGRYRVRIVNNGNRTANFLKMSLNRILLDWWIPFLLLVLAVLALWFLWHRSDSEMRSWVLQVAVRPWRWRSHLRGN